MLKDSSSNITLSDWLKEHIKTPPPINVTEDQRKQAQEKIKQIKQLQTSKHNSL